MDGEVGSEVGFDVGSRVGLDVGGVVGTIFLQDLEQVTEQPLVLRTALMLARHWDPLTVPTKARSMMKASYRQQE